MWREVMRAACLISALVLLSPPARAGVQQHVHELPTADIAAGVDAIIIVTVNPEARVSAIIVGSALPRVECGKPVELPVRILNQAYLTAGLEARLVGPVPAGVALEFSSAPLTGSPQEMRTLRIKLPIAALVDLTVAFQAHAETPDLGGRDRIHFLLRCQ